MPGWLLRLVQGLAGASELSEPSKVCSACGGSGKISNLTCQLCAGRGRIFRPDFTSIREALWKPNGKLRMDPKIVADGSAHHLRVLYAHLVILYRINGQGDVPDSHVLDNDPYQDEVRRYVEKLTKRLPAQFSLGLYFKKYE